MNIEELIAHARHPQTIFLLQNFLCDRLQHDPSHPLQEIAPILGFRRVNDKWMALIDGPPGFTERADDVILQLANLLYTSRFIAVNGLFQQAPWQPDGQLARQYLEDMGRPLPTPEGWLVEIYQWKKGFAEAAKSIKDWQGDIYTPVIVFWPAIDRRIEYIHILGSRIRAALEGLVQRGRQSYFDIQLFIRFEQWTLSQVRNAFVNLRNCWKIDFYASWYLSMAVLKTMVEANMNASSNSRHVEPPHTYFPLTLSTGTTPPQSIISFADYEIPLNQNQTGPIPRSRSTTQDHSP